MAQSINAQALDSLQIRQRSDSSLWKLRLALGFGTLFGVVMDLFALSWDIQWHTAVGRDRTLTAPHLFILGGIIISGLVALTAVLIETRWARRDESVAKSSTPFAGFFSSSLGAYLVGYGSLASAIAFPIDQYWHTLYGIDVSIWAPFHIMAISGLCVSCLGVAYMLANSAHLAAQHGAKWAERVSYAGVVVALAALMGQLTYLLEPSISNQGYITLGSLSLTVYPLMFGAFTTFVLVTAIRALPWRWAATSVAAVNVLFGLLNYLIIPPLMTFTLAAEQQSMLPNAPTVSSAARVWQYGLIIAAVILDVVVWNALRKGWSSQKTNRRILITALIGASLSALSFPYFLLSALAQSGGGLKAEPVRVGSAAPPPPSLSGFVVIIIVSLLLGLLGIYIGHWFGTGVGESMRREEYS